MRRIKHYEQNYVIYQNVKTYRKAKDLSEEQNREKKTKEKHWKTKSTGSVESSLSGCIQEYFERRR